MFMWRSNAWWCASGSHPVSWPTFVFETSSTFLDGSGGPRRTMVAATTFCTRAASTRRNRRIVCASRASHPKASERFPQRDARKQLVADSIRGIVDFPRPGILFWDVTTLLLDAKAFQTCMDLFVERYKAEDIDAVAGLEARGLVFGAPLALALDCSFVMLRKPNKLPAEKVTEAYDLEYGSDRIEMHVDAIHPGQKVLLVDDLIATGGTMAAGVRLIERVGATVHECASVMELPELHGRDKLEGKPVFILITSENEPSQQ